MDRRIGSRYELLDRLGRGAMGEVWRARTIEGETVAVKILRSELAEDPALVSRFLQEKALLTRVDHRAVVRVRDLVVEGDRLAIVMDLVEGGNLREMFAASAPLAPRMVATLVADVADGLAGVHAAGIVHRDVKPENVLVESGGHARLTDFGISGLVDGPNTRMTKLVGTPEYMAPEVVERAPATSAVDVYGLGIVLFELLAGVTPFAGGHELAVLERHRSAPCPRLPWAPEPLTALLDRMLAKDPGARPTAVEAAAGLRALPLADMGPQPLLDPSVVAAQAIPITSEPNGPGHIGVRMGTLHSASDRAIEDEVVSGPISPQPGRRPSAVFAGFIALVVILAGAIAVTVSRSDSRPSAGPAPIDATTTSPTDPTPVTTSTSVVAATTTPATTVTTAATAPPPTRPPTTLRLPPTSAAPPPVTSPPPPAAEPVQPGQWRPPPSDIANHCTPTQQAGPNLWYQMCWSGPTPMVVVRVSGILGKSPNHQLAVPRVWTVVNGVHSRGTSCPSQTFRPANQAFACIDETGSSGPGMNVESFGRLQHDGIESVLFSPRK